MNDAHFIPLFLLFAVFLGWTIRSAIKAGFLSFEGFEVERSTNPLGFRILLGLVWIWFLMVLAVPVLILMGWKGIGR